MNAPRVLHVEDDDLDAEVVRRLARRVDPAARVERSVDGEAALERLRASAPGELPDLVLLDLNMPRLDGHGCLREIRANPAWHALPVVILTTSMRASDRDTALAGGAAGYVVKPMSRAVLAGLLDETCRPGGAAPARAG